MLYLADTVFPAPDSPKKSLKFVPGSVWRKHCSGSVTFGYGSFWLTDPDPCKNIQELLGRKKNLFFHIFQCFNKWKLQNYKKIFHKKLNPYFATNISVRSTLLWEKGRIRVCTCDSRIRMRIWDAQKHTDPTDLDPDARPEHWKKVLWMRTYNVKLDHEPCSCWIGEQDLVPYFPTKCTANLFRNRAFFSFLYSLNKKTSRLQLTGAPFSSFSFLHFFFFGGGWLWFGTPEKH